MNDNLTQPERPLPVGKLGIGLVLLVVGVAAFSDAIDIWDARDLVHFWPVVPIVIGIFSEFESLSRRQSGGGYFLIAFGVWMLFGTQHYFDLTVRTAMPLGIVIVGLGTIVHALVDLPATKKNEENGNELQ